MTYLFDGPDGQLERGRQGENALDAFYGMAYTITRATKREELQQGFDRVYVASDGRERKIEYKSDSWAHRTRNFALEVVSNDQTMRKGWIHTTEADWIVYLWEHTGQIFWFDPKQVRADLWKLTKKYPKLHAATNETYHSYNLLVPLTCFREYVQREDTLGAEDGG